MKVFAASVAFGLASVSLASCLLAPGLSAQETQAASQTIVTALAKGREATPVIPETALEVKVDGKKVQPLTWQPYGQGEVQLVLLLDNSARTSFGRNIEDLSSFIQTLPPNVSIGVAYMENGAAVFSSPISKNKADIAKSVHLPGGSPGSNASPYFCLQDLAKRWPAAPSAARREVLMITDGVDEYNPRYDPQDPYVLAAIDSANRAGLVIFSIYYRDQGRFGSSFYETDAGQNYLSQLADATGGNFYYEGLTNPVSLTPFLSDLKTRLNNQYELSVPVRPDKKVSYADLKLKTDIGSLKLKAANRVVVQPAGAVAQQ